MSEVVNFADRYAARPGRDTRSGGGKSVFFDRREFHLILDLYARMVASGEWRDYALAHDQESCRFSVFRRASDRPLYSIVKTPKLRARQGAYAVLAAGGMTVKRGHSLAGALNLFRRERVREV